MLAQVVPLYFKEGRDEDFDKQLSLLKELLVKMLNFYQKLLLAIQYPKLMLFYFPRF